MNHIKSLTSLFFLYFFLIFSLKAQDSTRFAFVTANDFDVAEDFVKEANAVMLLDSGYSYYNENLELIFQHNTRIKILNEDGNPWANVRIPYSNEDSIMNIKAVAYNLSQTGEVVSTPLNTNNISSEKFNDEINQSLFKVENARNGSIIEYSYQLKMNDWKNINNWYFQNDIPVLKSSYSTKIPIYMLFYKSLEGVRGLDNLKRDVKTEMHSGAKVQMVLETYSMKNIPAYIEEQDVPGGDYFLSKIKFNLAEYTLPNQATVFLLPEGYEELAYNWAADPHFREAYSTAGYLKDKVNQIYFREFSSLKNIQSFFFFVRNNFTIDFSMAGKSLEEVYKTRKGTPEQINLLLTKMLNQAGFNALVIAISTIDNRPTYPEFPNFELFNHFVSMVRVSDVNYFMDASDKNLLFNMLAPNSVNNGGLAISRAAPGFVELDYNFTDKEQVIGNFQITDSATVIGAVEVKREGYAVYNFDLRFLGNNRTYNDYLIETIFENMDWNIKNHEVNDEFGGDKIIKELLEYTRPVDSTARNYISIDPIVFNEYKINPFQEKERQNPITVYTPKAHSGSYSYMIPEGWQIMQLPQSKSFEIASGKARFIYSCKVQGNKVNIEYSLNINQVIYMSDEYPELRGFHELMVGLLNQKIVLIK
jgi:hypothetical protein